MLTLRRPVSAMAIFATTILIGMVTFYPASGDPGDGTENLDDSTAAAVLDYQEREGVTADLAEDAIVDQQTFSELMRDFDVTPGIDADVWIEPSSGGQSIHVRSGNSSFVSAVTEADTFSVSDVAIEDGELMTRAHISTDETAETVKAINPSVQGIHIRPSDGALVIETTNALSDSEIEEMRKFTGFDVIETNELDEAESDSITVRGGSFLTSCTSGFAATRGSEIGFYSAAHCGSSQNIWDSPTSQSGSSSPGTRAAYVHNNNGDIGFYRVPAGSNSLSSTFYGANGTAEEVTGPANVGVGTTVCHRGQTTGWQCGPVTSIAYQPTYDGACPGTTCSAVFVRIDAAQQGGDSGGPWVLGQYALGIHKGGSSSWSIYSQINYIPSTTDLY